MYDVVFSFLILTGIAKYSLVFYSLYKYQKYKSGSGVRPSEGFFEESKATLEGKIQCVRGRKSASVQTKVIIVKHN